VVRWCHRQIDQHGGDLVERHAERGSAESDASHGAMLDATITGGPVATGQPRSQLPAWETRR
jgi:hypothetical protein